MTKTSQLQTSGQLGSMSGNKEEAHLEEDRTPMYTAAQDKTNSTSSLDVRLGSGSDFNEL